MIVNPVYGAQVAYSMLSILITVLNRIIVTSIIHVNSISRLLRRERNMKLEESYGKRTCYECGEYDYVEEES